MMLHRLMYRDSAVGMVTRLRAGCQRNRGLMAGRSNRLLSKASRRAVGPIQPPIQLISGALPRGKAAGV